jgi:hypothetical protein
MEIESNKNIVRDKSAKVINFRNASNAVFGGQKETKEAVASKKVNVNM